MIKILDEKHKVEGCGYLLTATIVLTSMEIISDAAEAKKCPYIMFYDKTQKREIEINIKSNGLRVFLKDQNCVMFELEKPVAHFKAAEFSKRLSVNSNDKLELMSAGRRRTCWSIHGLSQIESGDNEIEYKKVDDDKGRVGGLIYRGDEPIGIHNKQDKGGKSVATLFSSLIDAWIKIISEKSKGYEHIEVIIAKSLFGKAESPKSSPKSSPRDSETRVEQPQPE